MMMNPSIFDQNIADTMQKLMNPPDPTTVGHLLIAYNPLVQSVVVRTGQVGSTTEEQAEPYFTMSNYYPLEPGIYTVYDYQYQADTDEWRVKRTVQVEAVAGEFVWVDFTLTPALNAPVVPTVIDPELEPTSVPNPTRYPTPYPEPIVYNSIGINEVSPGSTQKDGGAVILTTTGTDVWHSPDGFRYYYREAVGDFDILVKVAEMSEPHAYAKGGLMIRGSLEDDAIHAFLYANVPSRERVQFSRRLTAGSEADGTHLAQPFPMWLRLQRRGSVITPLTGQDGVGWQQVGEPVTINLPSGVFVGLAATSRDVNVPITVKFTGLSIIQAP